ncbi:MAG: phosphoglycolate phosphatase [Natronomonas sp.]
MTDQQAREDGNYEALVYDLDGTLVRLDVDWGAVTEEAAAVLRARGLETEGSLWDHLQRAEEAGNRHRQAVEEVIADHERNGARSATRLPLADELPTGVPTGVCSLNCEAACRLALELHGLDGHVRAIVGRDTVSTHKPDPEPLLAAVDRLGADPGATLFVGDSESDRVTAERAGVEFQAVADRQ